VPLKTGCSAGDGADEETGFLAEHSQSMSAGTGSESCGWMKSAVAERMVASEAPLNSAMPCHLRI
jgi:hypothetical protein